MFAREPSKWLVGDVEHLGRLVFSLSTKQINSIPLVSTQKHQTMQTTDCTAHELAFKDTSLLFHPEQTVLNKDTVEQVLVGQNRWEDSMLGRVCVTQCMDRHRQRQQTQSLIRGVVKARSRRAKGSVNNLCNFWCL